MYVIMDLEWFETEKHHICPTQIAALRVDDNWNTVSTFNELICPHEGVSVPWGHVAFSGYSSDSFVHAYSAHAIFDRLGEWLKSDDVLCWWGDVPAATLKLLLKAILKRNYPNKTCILRPYFLACVSDGHPLKGDPYSLAQRRGIPVPEVEHCSMNDVLVIQRLMSVVKIPADILSGPVPDRSKFVKMNVAEYLFLYDPSTNLLHISGGACIETLHDLRRLTTVKSCISKKYNPCPACCSNVWKDHLKKDNAETVRQRKCGYFFFADSKVFHRGSCQFILGATRNYSATVYYDTCINGGRTPCKVCKPVPGLITVKQPKEEIIGPWMKKHERRAFDRYTQAVKERSAADLENMSTAERKDMLILTSTQYAFWVAQGYGNFHLRSCRKLNGLSNLKGFETFQQATHAGYQPCRDCKPSKKHNMEISMPIETKERKDEKLEDVLAICTHKGLEHSYQDPILSIRTDSAEWEVNVTMRPVVIYHKPVGSNTFHQQHKMFMSVSDAIFYIAKHDSKKKPSIEAMLMEIRHKE